MSVKINSFGGPIIWILRKHCSFFTSRIMLNTASKLYKKDIEKYINWFYTQKETPLFQNVMIETINRCNGNCSFCPANYRDEKRQYKKMSDELYYQIIGQLRSLAWKGKLFLCVNNEPFIDKRIIDFAKYAKKILPEIEIAIISNGTLISRNILDEISCGLVDQLIINDYSKNYKLNLHIKGLYQYIKREENNFRSIDIRINRRYSEEILATRAGNAPNKPRKNNRVNEPCIYPFTDFIIFPDGQVGMCCNDCKEISNFGNVNQNTLKEIWENDAFSCLRDAMRKGRMYYSACKECDVVDAGGREKYIRENYNE